MWGQIAYQNRVVREVFIEKMTLSMECGIAVPGTQIPGRSEHLAEATASSKTLHSGS